MKKKWLLIFSIAYFFVPVLYGRTHVVKEVQIINIRSKKSKELLENDINKLTELIKSATNPLYVKCFCKYIITFRENDEIIEYATNGVIFRIVGTSTYYKFPEDIYSLLEGLE